MTMIQRLKWSDCGPGTGIPLPAPIEYAGQWVAWNKEHSEIVAHGKRLAEVFDAAIAAGHPDAVLQRVPQLGVTFVGKV
jgi:hypothetical protein